MSTIDQSNDRDAFALGGRNEATAVSTSSSEAADPVLRLSAEIVKLRSAHKVTAKRVAELSRQEKREKHAVIDARIAAALKGKGEGDTFERRVGREDVVLADAIEAAVARGMQTALAELGAVLAAWATGGAK